MDVILTVGHILSDIRVLVDEFATPDRESKIIAISRGLGGSAANVAVGVIRLGGHARIVGKVGMDTFGRMAVENLLSKGVDISGIHVDIIGETGFTIIIINKHGDIIMYGLKGSAEKLEVSEISERVLSGVRAVHIASLRLDTAIHVAKLARQNNILVSFDPGRQLARKGFEGLKSILKYTDVFLINHEECKLISRIADYEKASKILQDVGIPIVIIKLGSKGVFVRYENQLALVHAYAVKAIDTTGAGDSFVAGFLVKFLETNDVLDAVHFGNATAAIKVQRLGAQEIPTRKEVEEFLQNKKKKLPS